MEWAFGAFFSIIFGLFVWASYTVKRDVSKRIQLFVDDMFDSHPVQGRVDLLRKCLLALAADAEGQLDSLRQQGCIPPEQYIDELALDLDGVPVGDMFAKRQ